MEGVGKEGRGNRQGLSRHPAAGLVGWSSIPFLHPGNSPFPCWFSHPRLSILLPSPQSRGAVPESMPLIGHLLPALDVGHFRSKRICHQKSTLSLSLKIIGKCQGTCILGTELWTACPSDALSSAFVSCTVQRSGNFPILSQDRVLIFFCQFSPLHFFLR